MYERAQSVDLPSTLITYEGEGHVDWDVITGTSFTDLTYGLYQQVTKDAQAPEGC